jgi:DNA-binding PadR family transcriptional regulator
MDPLTPAVFHILLALAGEERHGYGIMQEVALLTSNQFTMGPGTLYGTLKRMLEAGLVEEAGERQEAGLGDERRRYYRITDKGRRAAEGESRRLELLTRLARSRSFLEGPAL